MMTATTATAYHSQNDAVKTDRNRHNMHHKVIVIDGELVITGSYNFTRSARVANAENLLILRGNPALVRTYTDNWQRHRAEAQLLRSLDELPPRRGKTDGRESDRRTPD